MGSSTLLWEIPQLRAVSTLARLILVKYQMNPQDPKDVAQAMGNVLREVALPLGIKVIPKL